MELIMINVPSDSEMNSNLDNSENLTSYSNDYDQYLLNYTHIHNRVYDKHIIDEVNSGEYNSLKNILSSQTKDNKSVYDTEIIKELGRFVYQVNYGKLKVKLSNMDQESNEIFDLVFGS